MLQSKLFTKTKREAPKDEEATNARLLIRAGFVDKVMAGVYTFLPLGWRVIKKIENIIREEMEAVGGQEILMPTLQPKIHWEKTGRWSAYDSLFRFKSHYSKIDYVLGPTHEEIVSPLLKKFVSSYKDLPRYVFQIQNKFRDEKRVKSGLLRTREFLMKDLYSFHTDEKDLDRYYEKVKKAYFRVFERVGLGSRTCLTFASGGTFSKYSHEFQTLTSAGEDIIYLCEKCRVAVNKEIIKEQNSCPECGNKKLKEEKAIEVGNIFKLKNRFSAAFNLKYKDKNGKERDVQMGCYGIGLNRLMGTIVEVFHDGKGIIWPESVAPFAIHLLKISAKGGSASGGKNNAAKIYNNLQKAGVEILYDDREAVSPGEKFADSDLIGIPWRAVVSEKTGNKIELKKRSETKTKLVSEKELLEILKQ
jgi:prolyl-tRNA synthetase